MMLEREKGKKFLSSIGKLTLFVVLGAAFYPQIKNLQVFVSFTFNPFVIVYFTVGGVLSWYAIADAEDLSKSSKKVLKPTESETEDEGAQPKKVKEDEGKRWWRKTG
jgi:hypothetical protein